MATYMKLKKNSLYYLKFYDHGVNVKNEIICEVVGWVIEDHPKRVVLSHWQVVSSDKDVVENNHEYTTIIKSCIIKRRKLQI
jgi:hypothetical protein